MYKMLTIVMSFLESVLLSYKSVSAFFGGGEGGGEQFLAN